MPDQLIDPVLIASHIIVGLQQIISRNRKPSNPSVLSFGRFIADGVTNVIPNEVTIQGTWRCMDEEWRADGLNRMKKMAEGIAESMGATCHVEVVKGYPYLKNHPELTRRTKQAAIAYMGEENVLDLDIWMAGKILPSIRKSWTHVFIDWELGMRQKESFQESIHLPLISMRKHWRWGPDSWLGWHWKN